MSIKQPATPLVDGEVLRVAMLDEKQLQNMNFAREEFNKLERALWPMLDLLMCHQTEGPACDVARHLEQIRFYSGNFCHRYRHLGASSETQRRSAIWMDHLGSVQR